MSSSTRQYWAPLPKFLPDYPHWTHTPRVHTPAKLWPVARSPLRRDDSFSIDATLFGSGLSRAFRICRWHPVLEAAATTGPLTDFNGSVRNKDLGENMAMLVQSMWSFKLESIHTKTFLPLSLYKQQNKEKPYLRLCVIITG